MMTHTRVAGIDLASYVFNAAGPNDVTLEELEKIGASDSAAIVMKTCTLAPREGNEEPRYARLPLGSINSMGLPNHGYEAYIRYATKLGTYGKPIVASVAGLQPDEFPILVQAFADSDVDLIELNLSCPNIKGKPQIGYDFDTTDRVLSSLHAFADAKPLGVKLPPYFDPVHWEQMAAVLAKHPIAFIVCINSVGNTLVIDPETERPVIRPKGGFGGLGGAYIKPVALANVRAFSQLMKERVSIVGVGGISTGTDAFEFLLAGADAVQIGTVFETEGVGAFHRINTELAELLVRKGYTSLESVKGTLRSL